MEARTAVVFLSIIQLISGFPTDGTDQVLIKMDPGPRYQYMAGPDGPELVDLWLKTSDVAESARFDPNLSNIYHLFTRSNPSMSQPIPLGNITMLEASNFDANKKTVFLVHGWRNTYNSTFNVHLVHAYVVAEDANVFMVDWSVGAAGNYLSALLNVKPSGEHVAQYITWLNSVTGAQITNYHIIGHSLGGQQVGIIGRSLDGAVPYITALDPAMPGWFGNSDSFKTTDGVYTEVIHSNGGMAGLIEPAGDVDFYPNGGSFMPGCSTVDLSCHHHMLMAKYHLITTVKEHIVKKPAHLRDVLSWCVAPRQRPTGGLNSDTREPSNQLVSSLPALDPAMPGWIFNPEQFKSTDAIYTEVIHTNGGFFGTIRPHGDVDFYPNGGSVMPGCPDNDCNHHQSIFYMAESLMQGGFTGRRCDSFLTAVMGNCDSEETLNMGGTTAKTGSTGVFYLTTNDRSPFSQG